MKKDFTILAPSQGVSQSPLVGFQDCRNLDIFTIPGIVSLNNILVKKSSTTVTGQINWFVRHPVTTAEVYALDNGGKVYKSADNGATWALMTGFTAGGHGNGLAIWKNYLIVARDAYLDVCGDGSATGITNANWTNGWQAIDSDVLWHPMIVSKLDTKLYGGAGKYVFTLAENVGQTFAPGTGATFTWTSQALTSLPTGYRIKCLEELGNNLMMGTWQGTAVTDVRSADMFTWDGTSSQHGQPICFDDYGIHAMRNVGNSLVVLAGISGTIYRCDGVNAYVIGQIPISVCNLTGTKYLEFYPGGICNYKNRIFFSIGNNELGVDGMGIWSLLQTGKGNILNLEHQISNYGVTGNDGTTKILKVSALLPITKNTLLAGWRDDTTYGIDLTNASAFTTSYGGSFVTPLYRIGNHNNLFKFSDVEFSLVKTLAANEGIKIEYRNNLTDSFTTLNTYPQSAIGSILSWFANIFNNTAIPKCELLQLRISLTGTTTSPSFQSITLQ